MSSLELLDKTRILNGLLKDNRKGKVVFTDICNCIHRLIGADVLVVSGKGKILGESSGLTDPSSGKLFAGRIGSFLDSALNDRLLNILSTKENVNLKTLGFEESEIAGAHALAAPILIAGKRLGTLIVSREDSEFSIEDIILCEYATTVVGLETMRSVDEEDAEENRREKIVRAAFSSLSASEARAVAAVLQALDGSEGVLVTSRIADEIGITRSVIVNGLKKMASAGVLSTQSSGMKGTAIRVLNEEIFEVAEKISRGE